MVVDVSGLTAPDRAHYLSSGPLFGSPTTLVWCETDEATARERLERRAAGLDTADQSHAKLDFWFKSLVRAERPSAAEARDLLTVNPLTAPAVIAELGAKLRGEGV